MSCVLVHTKQPGAKRPDNSRGCGRKNITPHPHYPVLSAVRLINDDPHKSGAVTAPKTELHRPVPILTCILQPFFPLIASYFNVLKCYAIVFISYLFVLADHLFLFLHKSTAAVS